MQVNGTLVLDDLMEIEGRKVDERLLATIHYKKNVMSAGLKDEVVGGHMVSSTAAIKSERETCPTQEETLGDFEKFLAREDRSELELDGLHADSEVHGTGFYIKNIRLILEDNGSYAIVADGAVAGYAFVSRFIVATGFWQRLGDQLKLYHGLLSLASSADEAVLRFDHDLTVLAKDKVYSLPTNGRTLRMKFGPSGVTTDDLTDTLR